MPIHSLHLGPWDLRTWTVFGQLPFLALMVSLYLAGRNRGWPWRANLLATAALAVGMSLGALGLPSVLGAVAGGILVWLVAQKVLGLRRPPLASLALGLTAVVAVGRWGCLLNDCCFGRPTDLPWGVRYASGSATFILQRALGLLGPDATASLPVHPYPLYESLGLLLWLPIALGLRRRLRSEAALLLFTVAYDLALRGCIDGTRAMVNVWWALLGSFHGIDVFQASLLSAALVVAAFGLAVEAHARPRSTPCPSAEPSMLAAWTLFAGLGAIGWLSDAGQTPFLHRVLLLALTASAFALRLPLPWSLPGWLRFGLAPAAAVVLVSPLGLHLARSAQANNGARDASRSRGWLYEVDHKHGAMVRIGSEREAPEAVEARRSALDLPPEPTPPPDAPALADTRRGHTWVGGGAFAGGASYRVGNSCGDEYTLYDRGTRGGWLEVEREVPGSPTSVFWLGGRGMALFESQTKTQHSAGADDVRRYAMQTYCGQLWAEWEHPNVTLGTGVMLGPRNYATGGQGSFDFVLRPSFHLRLGASFLGLDGGMFDRRSMVGPSVGHIGLSGSIGRGGARIRHPGDTLVRYFVGGVVFPGADPTQSHLMLGGNLELFATPRLMLGVQGGGGDDGGFGMGYVRFVLGR
jgi:prolipoprotein diacylglyceryltransferase